MLCVVLGSAPLLFACGDDDAVLSIDPWPIPVVGSTSQPPNSMNMDSGAPDPLPRPTMSLDAGIPLDDDAG